VATNVNWVAPVQFGGGQTLGPGVWVDLPFNASISLDSVQSIGMIFDARNEQALRTTTVGGDTRCLDNPVFVTASLGLTLSRNAPGADPVITVGLVPDPQPVNYQVTALPNTLLPTTRGELTLATFTPIVPLAPNMLAVSVALDALLIRTHVTSRARWNGRFALSLSTTSVISIFVRNDLTPLTLTSSQELFFAGLAGGPSGKARAVRDGRFAMPAFNAELIRDGDQPGLWVRPFDFDPEDLEATYRPRPGEGTIDDEIPNL